MLQILKVIATIPVGSRLSLSILPGESKWLLSKTIAPHCFHRTRKRLLCDIMVGISLKPISQSPSSSPQVVTTPRSSLRLQLTRRARLRLDEAKLSLTSSAEQRFSPTYEIS